MYVDFSSCCTGNDKYDDEIEIWFIVFSVCLQLVSTLREGLSLSLSLMQHLGQFDTTSIIFRNVERIS
jgi:hypothetical protein